MINSPNLTSSVQTLISFLQARTGRKIQMGVSNEQIKIVNSNLFNTVFLVATDTTANKYVMHATLLCFTEEGSLIYDLLTDDTYSEDNISIFSALSVKVNYYQEGSTTFAQETIEMSIYMDNLPNNYNKINGVFLNG